MSTDAELPSGSGEHSVLGNMLVIGGALALCLGGLILLRRAAPAWKTLFEELEIQAPMPTQAAFAVLDQPVFIWVAPFVLIAFLCWALVRRPHDAMALGVGSLGLVLLLLIGIVSAVLVPLHTAIRNL